MNAVTTIEPADEIALLLPGIGDEDLARRARLRAIRTTASALIGRTDSWAARQLAWMASDYITAFGLAPASPADLEDLIRLGNRLMLTALQLEQMADRGIEP